MRISKQQSEDNRARIIADATELFREKGFDRVGVADAMHAAGMTHGGFYNHFASKEDLAAAACRQALATAVGKVRAIAALRDDGERKTKLDAYLRRYVAPAARDASAPTCPMAAFAGEMPRQPEPVAAAYAEGLRDYLAALAQAGGDAKSRQQAIAQFSALAGALILARSVGKTDGALSDEILAAANAELDR